MMTRPRFLAPTALLVFGALPFAGCQKPSLVQGEVEAGQVDVSSKIPGRVARVLVDLGQKVRKGDPLAVLESPEVRAKLDQVSALKDAASAQNAKAEAGPREEEVRGAEQQWRRAEAAANLARTTWERLERLQKDGVVTAQRRDEAEANWKASRAAADAARAGYDMALAGARREDRASAAAVVRQAQGAVSEVEAAVNETTLVAPRDGEVASRNVEPGEMVAPGYPVVTLVDLTDTWVVFNLREDRLAGLKIGDPLSGKVPAIERSVDFSVSAISPLGDFATWRSTSSSGGFDLKTFEVRARTTRPVDGLRPGMSVLVDWSRRVVAR